MFSLPPVFFKGGVCLLQRYFLQLVADYIPVLSNMAYPSQASYKHLHAQSLNSQMRLPEIVVYFPVRSVDRFTVKAACPAKVDNHGNCQRQWSG
jgi:hypothetical protein